MNYLKEMEGQEVWTNAFSDRFMERVCVVIRSGWIYHDGIKFKPTREEVHEMWEDYAEQELGSPEQIMEMIRAEFE